MPERLGARRTWGLATQLYSVRSGQSWGVGDLTDLVDLAVWSGSVYGAGYVLVNPLHPRMAEVRIDAPQPFVFDARMFERTSAKRVQTP